jgi:O-antigen/teichoic acid export membrane protein
MSRAERFLSSLASGYLLVGATLLYNIIVVPLALHYLDNAEFGLWALVAQLSSYLTLLDLGMTGSVARFLVDCKDDVNGGTYGSILKTGQRVLALQGVAVAILGAVIAVVGPAVLPIPDRLQTDFAVLMVMQSLLSSLALALRTVGVPLWSHQRSDITYLAASTSLLIGIGILWAGFRLGWGVYSVTASTAVSLLVEVSLSWFASRRLGLYPSRDTRGTFDRRLFRGMLAFGKDMFVLKLGFQLASASQIILVTRIIGLEGASAWSISTKGFNMAQQLVGRILDSSAAGLTEIAVEGERALLLRRFRDVVSVTGILAVAGAAGLAVLNASVVEIWTSERIYWLPRDDFLLGLLLFFTSIARCHAELVGVSKDVRSMKYIYLAEGAAFVALAIPLGNRFGFSGILSASIVCSVVITGTYALIRTATYFRQMPTHVALWVARPASLLVLVGALASCVPLFFEATAMARVGLGVGVLVLIVVPSLWMFGFTHAGRAEALGLLRRVTANIMSKADRRAR